MPPVLIIALVGAVLALLARDEEDLPQEQQEDLKKLQDQLAEARRNLRHAHNAKKRFIAQTGARVIENDK
jgi:cellobiose-specific phosphotransferase system component IIA